jgi:hypothetical protein
MSEPEAEKWYKKDENTHGAGWARGEVMFCFSDAFGRVR